MRCNVQALTTRRRKRKQATKKGREPLGTYVAYRAFYQQRGRLQLLHRVAYVIHTASQFAPSTCEAAAAASRSPLIPTRYRRSHTTTLRATADLPPSSSKTTRHIQAFAAAENNAKIVDGTCDYPEKRLYQCCKETFLTVPTRSPMMQPTHFVSNLFQTDE